jgi:electron transfer flavoprotein beta subunit
MLNIIVCMKQVLDPEAPVSSYQIDAETKRVVQRGVPPVLSPFDENALEAALRIKDNQKIKIITVSMGRSLSKAIVRKALAVGADQVVLLEDSVFEDLDSYATTSVLTAAIKKIGKYDLILTGMQAADTNAGVVGSGIAETLGISSVTEARKVELDDSKARVWRVVSDGYEVIETPLPVLITVSNELGELRSATVRDIMAAQKKPITTWNVDGLGVQVNQMSRTKLVGLFKPQKEVICELVKGETEDELGRNLASKLKENKII